MAWSAVGGYGSGQTKVSGTTLDLYQPVTVIAAGTVIVVTIAADNVQTTDGSSALVSSVNGSYSGAFTKALEYTNGAGAAGAGVTCSVWYKRVATQIAAGNDNIVITLGSAVAARCASAYMFTNTGSTCTVAAVSGSADDVDPGVMTISGLTSREYLFVRAVATERGNYGFGASTNYTSFGQNTTTSPGDGSDVAIGAEYRILTGTGDTTDPITGTPESASVYVAFMDVAAATNADVTGVVGTGAIGSAASGIRANVAVTGVSATTGLGATTQSGKAGVTLTNLLAYGSLGQPAYGIAIYPNVSGVSATGAVGDVGAGVSVAGPATGVSASAAIGVATGSGYATAPVSGVSATASLGAILAQQPNQFTAIGFEGITGLGSVIVTAKATSAVTGVAATTTLGQAEAIVGTVVVSPVLAAATGAVGTVGATQTNTRAFMHELNMPGAQGYVGIVGIRAWGLVNDVAPSNWTNIKTG